MTSDTSPINLALELRDVWNAEWRREDIMNSIYKPCERCAELRTAGNWADALDCYVCKGKGIVRTRESWICNGCGGCLCPDNSDSLNGQVPFGLVDASVAGGYNSSHLSDTTTYKFSMCEACLKALFGGFKVPPRVGEYLLSGGGDVEDTEPYAKELEDHNRQVEQNKAHFEKHKKFVEENRCTEQTRNEDSSINDYCGEPATLILMIGTDKYPHCMKHGRDCYAAGKDTTIHADGRMLTYEFRATIGRRYLTAFAEGKELEPVDEHQAAIFITTLFSLVAKPKTWERSANELRRLTHVAPASDRWVGHRLPLAFSPGAGNAAAAANAWLAWGQDQGYANGVAHALLGYDAESLWDK